MAKTDWDITGDGGISVINEGGSMRCQLSGVKYMLWNGRGDFTDSEIIADIRLSTNNTNARGGLLLRSNATIGTFYRCRIYGATNRTYYIDRVVNGVSTQLASVGSSQPYNIYTRTRFRVDGFQLSIEEYLSGAWNLVTTVEDTNHAILSGYAGLTGISVNTSYNIRFDNIDIGEP